MNDLLILLSPSKGMNTILQPANEAGASILFPSATHEVVHAIHCLTEVEAKKRFKVSEKLWPEVAKLWKESASEFENPSEGVQGLYAYVGEAFKFLDTSTLSTEATKKAVHQLAVLSALYGVVEADAWIRPYRLEMQMKLEVESAKSLYTLWKPIITQWLKDHPAKIIVDACSGEYSKAVEWDSIDKTVVQVDFKQRKNGQLKSVSAFSKQARGAFARWILEEDVQTISDLYAFNQLGYELHSNNDNKLVFLRDSQ